MIDGKLRCPECGVRIKNGHLERPAGARLRCPICSYDLFGLPVVGGRVACPECGRGSAVRDIDLANPIPGFGRALAVMCFPPIGAVAVALALKSMWNGVALQQVESALVLLALAWSLSAPLVVARGRAAANARSPRVAFDEAVTGYVITLIVSVLAIALYLAM
jgi:predicted RNA-binding Zn-ribbon protein involved in translation (DUF1610 family)